MSAGEGIVTMTTEFLKGVWYNIVKEDDILFDLVSVVCEKSWRISQRKHLN